MIGSLRGRASFELLRREGVSVRFGALSLVMRLDESLNLPHVAFSIPRTVGPAVVRNRLRRRLRDLLRTRARDERLLPGQLLLVCRSDAAALSYRELSDVVDRMFDAWQSRVEGSRRGPR